MKQRIFLALTLSTLLSCNQNENKSGPGNNIPGRIKKELSDIAVDYARGKLSNSTTSVGKDGIISVARDQIRFEIDPSQMITGLIDDDSEEDAMVSVASYDGQFLITKENLTLLKKSGRFILSGILEGDMKFLRIKDRVIYTEVQVLASDSPNYGCHICKEIVRYQYSNGELVKIK